MLIIVALGASAARADLLQDLGATFQRVAQDLAAGFPKVETRVAAVTGDEVRLEGAGVAGLRPGLELDAYRRGAVFRHPITNQVLGHSEEPIATLQVTAVTREYATARVVVTESERAPAVGDGARITAGRLPVAVLPPLGVSAPFESADQTALLLVARFSALLDKTGRFQAMEPTRVLDAAKVEEAGQALSPLELARRLKAPAVLSSRLVQEGRVRYLETAWISGRTGTTLVGARTPVIRAVYAPRFAWEETPELDRRYPLEGPVRGLAVADLDGDGRPELVVADERTVTLYRWQDGAGLSPVPGEFRPGGTILSVDAAPVNGPGPAQVVVVDYRGDTSGLHGTVLEMTGERLRPIYETRGRYLRIVPVGAERWLLAQPTGQNEPFDPTIRRLLWQEGRYREGPTLRLPRGVTVYGLALMRLTGSAEPDVVALTPEDRLAVWTARGRRVWTSAEPYGGATVTFPFASEFAARAARGDDEVVGRILGRVLVLPDAPEGPEALVFENVLPLGGQARTLFPRLTPAFFTRGRVHRLRWKDGGFVHVWQSRLTDGYIADFAYGDLEASGVPDVVVGVVPRGANLDTLNPLASPRGHLTFYELP